MSTIFAHDFRAISSVGSEHLPYKQRVGGSTPSSPTKKDCQTAVFFVFIITLLLSYLVSFSVEKSGDM